VYTIGEERLHELRSRYWSEAREDRAIEAERQRQIDDGEIEDETEDDDVLEDEEDDA